MKLTDKIVATLTVPAGKRVEFADDDFPGLWLRVSATSKMWNYQGRIRHGRWVRERLGPFPLLTCAKARRAAQVAKGRLLEGKDPRKERRAAKAAKLTVQAALADYLDVHGSRHKASYRSDCERMLRAELKPLADKSIADLDGEQVLKWFRDQTSVAVAAKATRVLRAVLRHADKRHGVRDRDGKVATEIIGDLRMWPKANRRQTTLANPRDWLHSLDCVPAAGANLLKGLLFQGLRRDELRTLTWAQVDLKASTILLPDPKGRRPQVVPMVRQVSEIVAHRVAENPHALPGDAVFSTDVPRQEPHQGRRKVLKSRRKLPIEHGRPIGTSTLQRWVGRVGKASAPFALHDLRRTFVSTAVNLGLSSYVVKKLVHHSDGGDVTAGYVSLDVEQLRQHAQRVADALFAPPPAEIPLPQLSDHGMQSMMRATRLAPGDLQSLILEAKRPRAIDTSGGLFNIIEVVHRQGVTDGQRTNASKGGLVKKKIDLGNRTKRLKVHAAYFIGKGRQAWAHPQAKEHVEELERRITAKKLKAGRATICKDLTIMKWIDNKLKRLGILTFLTDLAEYK